MFQIQPDGYGVYYEMDEEDSKPIKWDYSHLITKGDSLPLPPPKTENNQLMLF
jgi:hypothetical protein